MTNVETADPIADVAPQTPHVAPLKGRSMEHASKKRGAARARKATKSAKPKNAATKKERSKTDIILSLIGQKSGATLAAIMNATDWQPHSVRGFISLAQSRRGLKVISTKDGKGDRVYRVASKPKPRKVTAQGKGK